MQKMESKSTNKKHCMHLKIATSTAANSANAAKIQDITLQKKTKKTVLKTDSNENKN
jgi:hypothetical protein